MNRASPGMRSDAVTSDINGPMREALVTALSGRSIVIHTGKK